MLKELVEKRKELHEKQDRMHKVFKEAGPEIDLTKVTSVEGGADSVLKFIRDTETNLSELGERIDQLVLLEASEAATKARQEKLEKGVSIVMPDSDVPHSQLKVGSLFVNSKAFTDYKGGGAGPVDELKIDLKTAFTTTAGWAPETIRSGKVVEFATRPIQVVDIIPSGTTNQTAIVYMEETTFTNAAVEVGEAGAKPEATLALTERSSTVRKIAVWIPVTSEQLEDVAQVESYLNNRLSFMLRQRLDLQLLRGNGIAPNLMGINNTVGIQTFVLAGDRFDAIYTAAKDVRVTGQAEPNVAVFHPNDWEQIRLMRTDDGLYILGNPTEPGPERIWGLGKLETTAQTEDSVTVGDFANFCQLFEKKGIEVQISDSHDTYFIYNKLAIRAEMRVAFPVYRPAAFCVITGF